MQKHATGAELSGRVGSPEPTPQAPQSVTRAPDARAQFPHSHRRRRPGIAHRDTRAACPYPTPRPHHTCPQVPRRLSARRSPHRRTRSRRLAGPPGPVAAPSHPTHPRVGMPPPRSPAPRQRGRASTPAQPAPTTHEGTGERLGPTEGVFKHNPVGLHVTNGELPAKGADLDSIADASAAYLIRCHLLSLKVASRRSDRPPQSARRHGRDNRQLNALIGELSAARHRLTTSVARRAPEGVEPAR